MMRPIIILSCTSVLLSACGGSDSDFASVRADGSAGRFAPDTVVQRGTTNMSAQAGTGSTGTATISIRGVTFIKGEDYSPNPPLCMPTGPQPRPFAPGFTSALLTNGGIDGFDCGLNLPSEVIDPGDVVISAGTPQPVKVGEAALNERALIAYGTFPVGDGRSFENHRVTLNLNIGDRTLTFNGIPDLFVGGSPAFNDPALTAICDDPATAEANAATYPQCVDDAAVDFRIVFSGAQTIEYNGATFSVSVPPLVFTTRRAPVNIIAEVTLQNTGGGEPGGGADPFGSMRECNKATTTKGSGKTCKDMVAPKDRGYGKAK
ncbi:hypothetical protein [Noviherbaspirillum aerium]|uniref:hypothetical protein n=1 Tax=Noviherbaspirillum aerium TaxID=2588497 RepID=UPI00124C285B|nr:hypothetical protein [Noviherbaspirillum aerium]